MGKLLPINISTIEWVVVFSFCPKIPYKWQCYLIGLQKFTLKRVGHCKMTNIYLLAGNWVNPEQFQAMSKEDTSEVEVQVPLWI